MSRKRRTAEPEPEPRRPIYPVAFEPPPEPARERGEVYHYDATITWRGWRIEVRRG